MASWFTLGLTLTARGIANPKTGAALLRVGWRFRARSHHRQVGKLTEIPHVRPGHVKLQGDAEAMTAGGIAHRPIADADVTRQAQETFDAGKGAKGGRALSQQLGAGVGAIEREL